MSQHTSSTRYGRGARFFHWATAALILVLFPVGLYGNSLPVGPTRLMLGRIHLALGVTILIMTLVRLVWRSTHRPPALPESYPAPSRFAAHAAHWLLYGLLIGLPVLGLTTTFITGVLPMLLGFPLTEPLNLPAGAIPSKMHLIGVWTLLGLLVAHIGAALMHQFVWKDGILRRMA